MNLYRLAVCEDDEPIREELCSFCRDFLTENHIEHTITAFSAAQDLKEAFLSGSAPFDLLILDIQMKDGITGMELARFLRERHNQISILFITGCEDYLPEGYSVRPIHFLLKPVDKKALGEALLTDWKLNHRPKNAMLKQGSKMISLTLAQVQYIESYNHKILVHQPDGERSYLLSLSETEKQLPASQFARCHNSYLVNLEYVQEIERTSVLLRDGTRLPVGRTYYKSFQSAFIRFMNR